MLELKEKILKYVFCVDSWNLDLSLLPESRSLDKNFSLCPYAINFTCRNLLLHVDQEISIEINSYHVRTYDVKFYFIWAGGDYQVFYTMAAQIILSTTLSLQKYGCC